MADAFMPIIIGDRDKIFIGAAVILRGIRPRQIHNGLIVKIHESGVIMTDVDGEERAWDGLMPIIDVLIVERDPVREVATEIPEFLAIAGARKRVIVSADGIVSHVRKIPWLGDIERRASFRNLPPMMIELAPRYLVVGELVASL